ncbi:MAG: SOS response-associated peptidase [Acidobacteriota bacterium]
MCGRFSLIVDASVLADVFNVDPPRGLTPRYNIAPTQVVPIVRATGANHRELTEARWGLVPSWAKDAKMGARMINARGETVAEKPSFRSALKSTRCLVPASGFFEWVKNQDRSKTPHFIHFTDGRVFAFAGLWERWTKGGGEPLETFTIITTEPNEVVVRLHDRMPVILAPDHFDEWLEPSPLRPDRLRRLLSPFPEEGMEAYPVSTRVNSPANDDASCVARLS